MNPHSMPSEPGRTRTSLMSAFTNAKGAYARLSPRQRQFALLAALLGGGVGLLWMIFAFSGSSSPGHTTPKSSGEPSRITNIDVMPPGAQVNPVDQWVGTAGRKLAQYENEREEQGRLNKDRQAFEARTLQRFSELEQKLTSAQQAAAGAVASANAAASAAEAGSSAGQPGHSSAATSSRATSSAEAGGAMPPASSLPPPPTARDAGAMPAGMPGWPTATEPPPAPVIARVSLIAPSQANQAAPQGTSADGTGRQEASTTATPEAKTISSFLPVSFTRGTLLGGLDAPTGGQSQSNPQPVLIRLSDNSVLPNEFRGEYRNCFVIAAGYGDISSERAYLRTENLSCVRADGATLEVRIQGSVYGEDGKVGMRGRLVTKQGQMLANALLAGVVSGIGQGLSTANTNYSTSALGTVASTDSNAEAYRAGIGSGVGKALDRLAQYYIKLAENTFPVIEVDAGREIDVVITKGVRIDVPMTAQASNGVLARPTRLTAPETRYLEVTHDENY